MSDPDQPAETRAEFERVKARWYSDELHRPEFWADLASRDVPFLIGEVERLRGELETWTGVAESAQQAEREARTLLVNIRTQLYHFFNTD
jgi:hypothetical protein